MKKTTAAWIVAGTIGLTVLAGAGPAGAGMKVHAGGDPDVDFSGFKTYAWSTEGTPAGREAIEKAIVATVERELGECGLVKVDGDPDLLVETSAFGQGNPGLIGRAAWFEEGVITRIDVDESATGTLWVDLLDPGSREPVWSAIATSVITGKLEKVPEKVDKIVTKMFKDFPTRAK